MTAVEPGCIPLIYLESGERCATFQTVDKQASHNFFAIKVPLNRLLASSGNSGL